MEMTQCAIILSDTNPNETSAHEPTTMKLICQVLKKSGLKSTEFGL